MKNRRDFRYLSPKHVTKLLTEAPTRLVEHQGTQHLLPWKSQQVMVHGKWLNLCRTDLKDDIRTYDCISFAPGASAKTPKIVYGARLTKCSLCLIDSWSDG